MTNHLEIISQAPLFHGLSEDSLKKIYEITTEESFGKDESIFFEGESAATFYVVVEGQVKIYKLSRQGKEQILHIYGPGNPFGEVPVFSGSNYPANALALKKTTLLRFNRSDFYALVEKDPSLALNFIGILAGRLREFTVQIERLTLMEMPARLASYLLYLSGEQAEKNEVNLAISKGQIASLLGTVPETLSRIFARMSSQNLIKVQGSRIIIIDQEGLEDLSEKG